MSRKPSSSGPRRSNSPRTVKPTQTPSIARALALQAVETWAVPAAALGAATVFWLLGTFSIVSDATAVVGVAGALVVLTLFSSFRRYFFATAPERRWISLGFAVLWGLFVFTSFYRYNFPGDPVAFGVLHPGAESIALPEAGRYAVVVDGHFTATGGQGDRLGHYRLDAVSRQRTERSISGDFEDSFARQRLGRRGSTVVEIQHTAQRHVVDLPAGTELRAAEIDQSLEPALRVAVFPASAPWVFPVVGVAGLALALVLEKWLDGDGSATMTVGVSYFTVDQYLRWASPHPQMKTLIGFLLIGGIIGAPLAVTAWRIVPRRWVVARR